MPPMDKNHLMFTNIITHHDFEEMNAVSFLAMRKESSRRKKNKKSACCCVPLA